MLVKGQEITLADLYDDCRDFPDGHKRVEDFLYGLVKTCKGRATGIRLRGREKYVVFNGTAIGRPLGIYVSLGDNGGPRIMLQRFFDEIIREMQRLRIAPGYNEVVNQINKIIKEKSSEPLKPAEPTKIKEQPSSAFDFQRMDRKTLERLLKINFPAAVQFFSWLLDRVVNVDARFFFEGGQFYFRAKPDADLKSLLGPLFFAAWARTDYDQALARLDKQIFFMGLCGAERKGLNEAKRVLRAVLK